MQALAPRWSVTGDGHWLNIFCSTTPAHQESGKVYYIIHQEFFSQYKSASDVMLHYCYQLGRIDASFQEGSLLPSHSSEACRGAGSLGRPRGCLFLQPPSDTRTKDGGSWARSAVTCVSLGCTHLPARRQRLLQHIGSIKPCLPCTQVLASQHQLHLTVQTAQEMSLACPAAMQTGS